jgi:hypothetical protein
MLPSLIDGAVQLVSMNTAIPVRQLWVENWITTAKQQEASSYLLPLLFMLI